MAEDRVASASVERRRGRRPAAVVAGIGFVLWLGAALRPRPAPGADLGPTLAARLARLEAELPARVSLDSAQTVLRRHRLDVAASRPSPAGALVLLVLVPAPLAPGAMQQGARVRLDFDSTRRLAGRTVVPTLAPRRPAG